MRLIQQNSKLLHYDDCISNKEICNLQYEHIAYILFLSEFIVSDLFETMYNQE